MTVQNYLSNLEFDDSVDVIVKSYDGDQISVLDITDNFYEHELSNLNCKQVARFVLQAINEKIKREAQP